MSEFDPDPLLDAEDLAKVADTTDPQAWAELMLDALSLWHDASLRDVTEFLTVYVEHVRKADKP